MDTQHTQPSTVRDRHALRAYRHRRRLLLAAALTGAAFSVQPLAASPATADPSAADWAQLRQCESSDRYDTNTGNGYYGAYQFDLTTWRSVGGTGRPDQASPAEQDYRALYLYRMRGWQPWTCAGIRGLSPDADAASGARPTRSEAAYIGGAEQQPSQSNSGGEHTARPNPDTPEQSEGAEETGAAVEADAGAESRPDTEPEGPSWQGEVYRYGDCAAPLRSFQLRMSELGYDFRGTGCYYRRTRQAVLDLQRSNGIRDSGLLGPKTWRAAWNGTSPL